LLFPSAILGISSISVAFSGRGTDSLELRLIRDYKDSLVSKEYQVPYQDPGDEPFYFGKGYLWKRFRGLILMKIKKTSS